MKNTWHCLVILLTGIALFSTACSSAPDNQRLQPSNTVSIPFDETQYQDFADYVRQTRSNLQKNKIYLNTENAAKELEAAAPFERLPAANCPTNTQRK